MSNPSVRNPRKRVRGLGAVSGTVQSPIIVAITSPQDGQSVTDGTPISFTGTAGKAIPSTPDQAGSLLHSLPGSGWVEIAPGQWQSQTTGDVEYWTLWRVGDLEWWGVAEATSDPSTYCSLFSERTGQGSYDQSGKWVSALPPDQDFWVCPTGAFLPGQSGFTPPDLSELIEWYDEAGNKIGEGATIQALLSTGAHSVTAQVTQGGQVGKGGPVNVTVKAATAAGQTQQPEPTGGQQGGASTLVNTSQSGSSGWLWLLLLLLAAWAEEKKE